MAILPIRLYPDAVLRQRAQAISVFDEALSELAANMFETMYAAPGVGLAAPQVGVLRRLVVIDLSVGKTPTDRLVLVNPVVSAPMGETLEDEGCLSIPEFTAKLTRPERVRVKAQDLAGNTFEREAEGLLARAICHEVDHLEGVLFVDHLRGLRRERAARFLRRLVKETRAS